MAGLPLLKSLTSPTSMLMCQKTNSRGQFLSISLYLYDVQGFSRVTSYTRGALLLGRFLGYSVAQLLILLKWGTYQTLNIISLAALCIALIFAVILPSISWKSAYERKLCSVGG